MGKAHVVGRGFASPAALAPVRNSFGYFVMALRDGALAQLGERLLCKHQVIGSIPIGSTSSKKRRRRSESYAASLRERPALRSAPIRRSFAVTDGRKRARRRQRSWMMKRTGIPVVDTGRDGAIGALPIFDIVNGFFKSMP